MPFNLLSTDGEIQLSATVILGKTTGYTDGMVMQDWNPFPSPTFNDRSTAFLWDWGAAGGHDTIGTRKLKWTTFISGTTMADLMVKIQELSYTLSPSTTEKELCFQIGNAGYTYFGRPRGMEVTRLDTAHFYAWVECRWEALDPRYYENTTVTVTDAAVPSSNTNGTMASQTPLATASAPTPWQVIIRPNGGTITWPSMVQGTNAANIVKYLNVAIPSGRELYIDGRTRTVFLRDAVTGANSGDASHLMSFASIWWDFPAYTAGAATFAKAAATVTSTWIVTYRKAQI